MDPTTALPSPATLPSWFDWLTLAAIFLGPIFALLAQRALDVLREKSNRRAQLYFDLMSTRATPYAIPQLNALNSIDVVFKGRRYKKIRDAWQQVLAHVGVAIPTDPERLSQWTDRLNDLKVDLFREIGNRVGYNFSTDYLKRHIYYPTYWGEIEMDLLTLRKAAVSALQDGHLNIKIVESPPAESSPAGRKDN